MKRHNARSTPPVNAEISHLVDRFFFGPGLAAALGSAVLIVLTPTAADPCRRGLMAALALVCAAALLVLSKLHGRRRDISTPVEMTPEGRGGKVASLSGTQ